MKDSENKAENPLGITEKDIEEIKREYGLDLSSEKVVELINSGLSVKGIRRRITEDYFLKKLIEIIEKSNPAVRLGGLKVLGQFMGWLKTGEEGRGKRKSVIFSEES